MMLDATQRYSERLTVERLWGWHHSLVPLGYSGLHAIRVAAWGDDREGPRVVASGPMGKERVHFQAPPAESVPAEMARFLDWFESEEPSDPLLKAGVGHLWFETIHPFDDGNGRIGRAIMDMALARADGTSERFYSMTAEIHARKAEYHAQLEAASKGDLDVTDWLVWFVDRLGAALVSADASLALVKRKQSYWAEFSEASLNLRQTNVMNLLLEGFRGKLPRAEYAKLAKCSDDTALRDLSGLVDLGMLVQRGTGRGTHYELHPRFALDSDRS